MQECDIDSGFNQGFIKLIDLINKMIYIKNECLRKQSC
jgi:hypothetical protein